MENTEKNNWDKANRQNLNHDPQEGENEEMYRREAAGENPNIDADGYGSESARSEHGHYSAGVSGRSGNTHHSAGSGTRGGRNYSSGSSGVAGRSRGH